MTRPRFTWYSVLDLLLASAMLYFLPRVLVRSAWTEDTGDRTLVVLCLLLLASLGVGLIADACRGGKFFQSES